MTYANEDTGINIYTGGNNALVADNVTYDNGDHGIDDYDVTGGRIIGNTVYYNCTDGINVEGTSGNYNIENNVSMNNATGAVINPTPIAQPSTASLTIRTSCNRRSREHRCLRLGAGHDNGQLQPGLAERRRRRVHVGGHRPTAASRPFIPRPGRSSTEYSVIRSSQMPEPVTSG